MVRNKNSRFLTCILVIAFIQSAVNISAVSAQSETSPPETACATCHENLYLLHDTGKWYCSCKRRADCTVCHAGQADTYDEKLAHEGLITNPIQDNSAVCQSCHGDEAEEYIQRFALIAGVKPPRPPGPTYIPVALNIEAPVKPSGALVLAGKTYQSWQVIGLGLIAGLLAGIFYFGFRCWKEDCRQGRV